MIILYSTMFAAASWLLVALFKFFAPKHENRYRGDLTIKKQSKNKLL